MYRDAMVRKEGKKEHMRINKAGRIWTRKREKKKFNSISIEFQFIVFNQDYIKSI